MTEPAKPNPTNLLVVEDDEDLINLLRFLLEREGFKPLIAKDGREAANLINEMPIPSLALLDIMLPYTSGLELVQYIRGKPEWRDVPIVMLTANSNEADVVRALDAGANDYILKPFNPKELIARLRRFLRSSV